MFAQRRGATPVAAATAISKRNDYMRAEIETIVDEIKQGVTLLRRHL
jgi:hypothetical protein